MASKNIKGITIELGGDSTDLQKALSAPEKQVRQLATELREIDKALKFNPDSVELLSQKSSVLTSQIQAAADKLLTLRQASKQVQDQAARGQIGEEQYRAFQREIIQTENQLRNFQSQLTTTDGKINVLNGQVKSAADSADVFESAFDQAGNELTAMESKVNSLEVAMGNLVSKGIEIAIRAIQQFGGAAIERYDTLERFPRMLEQMGFEAEAATAATNKLSEGISGLPTTLNDIVSTAQSLTILTGNLDESVDIALALNNAFLASGASSSDAARGMEQYTQQLSKGSVDMQSWRTLQETMGYALRETAEAMGFAGKAATNDLYKALQSGSISFDEFNRKLIELSNRTNGFADVAKKSAGGIATSFTNMKTAVVRGITSIIQSINKNSNIQVSLESLGKGFENLLKTVSTVSNVLSTVFAPANWLLARSLGAVMQAVIPLTAALIAYKATLLITTIITDLSRGYTILQSLLLAFPPIYELVTAAQTKLNIAMATNPVGLVVGAIAALVVGLISLYNWLTGTKKAQDGLTESTESSTEAFGENSDAAAAIAQSGDGISKSYSDAADSVKQLSDQIYDSFEEAKKAADDFNKQFSTSGYMLVQDAQGHAQAISRGFYKMYQNLQGYIDEYYSGASETEKIAIAKSIYANREWLDQVKRNYYGLVPEVEAKTRPESLHAGSAIGSAMTQGMAEGIKSGSGQVANAARDMAREARDAIQNELDIHSPSRVTQELGKFTVDGFVRGILRSRNQIQNAMASILNLSSAMVPPTASHFAFAGAGSSSSSAAQTPTQIISDHSQYNVSLPNVRKLNELAEWSDTQRIYNRSHGGR